MPPPPRDEQENATGKHDEALRDVEGRQTPVVAALFRAYFQDGRDIGSHEVLADIADSAGMDAAVILRLLATDEDRAGLADKEKGFREMGVRSVPTFIVGGKHAVPGAQPPELWLKVIDELLAENDG